MHKLSLALKITNWCNMNCAHCCENSSSKCAPNIMPVEDVQKYAVAFRKLNVPKWQEFVFTGGEAMAPYYLNDFNYMPRALDAVLWCGFVPFVKTNGLWVKDKKMRDMIFKDLATAAYKHQKLVSLDISVDEFHNNVDAVAKIIYETVSVATFANAIRISLVGLNTAATQKQFLNLFQELSKLGLSVQKLDAGTVGVVYGQMVYPVYINTDANVANVGRAKENNLSFWKPSGLPDVCTGNCLEITNDNTAILNNKWREPIANQSLDKVLEKLCSQMQNRVK